MCTNMYIQGYFVDKNVTILTNVFRTFWPKKCVQTCTRLFHLFVVVPFYDKYVFDHFDLKNVYNFRTFWPKKRVQTCTRLFCCFTFFFLLRMTRLAFVWSKIDGEKQNAQLQIDLKRFFRSYLTFFKILSAF